LPHRREQAALKVQLKEQVRMIEQDDWRLDFGSTPEFYASLTWSLKSGRKRGQTGIMTTANFARPSFPILRLTKP
jgi:hypothetical protein